MNKIDRYQEWIKYNLEPFLKEKGFSRHGTTFFIQKKQNWGLINFQKSIKSTSDEIIFTVNVGVFLKSLSTFFSPTSEDKVKRPNIEECHWRERIGYLINHSDRWWTISDDISLELVTEQFKKYFIDTVIPKINEYVIDESIRDLWLSGISPGLTKIQRLINLSVLIKLLGPEDKLGNIINEMLKISDGKPFSLMVDCHIKKLRRTKNANGKGDGSN